MPKDGDATLRYAYTAHTAVHTAVLSGAADTGVQTNLLSFPTLCPVRSCGCVALQLRPGTHSLDDEKGHLYEDTPDLSARLVSEGQLFAPPPLPRQQCWRHIRRMVPCAGC